MLSLMPRGATESEFWRCAQIKTAAAETFSVRLSTLSTSARIASMNCDARWSSAILMAWSRLPNALCTVPRDTPAASATAVRLNCRGPMRRNVSAAAASSAGDTALTGGPTSARI
jgi:hypothetical protein